ncbi:MAG: methylmalonyl Co-A mutase-associated GTPase MeaB [Anaerolineae bacterium]
MDDLVAQALAGDRRAIARLISVIEQGGAEARQVLSRVYPRTGRAHIVGITGAPGTGKSTLVTELAKAYRRQGLSVGIIAVDPTSPFSGGAILGDRIRMRDLATDPNVFIRSMATRGSLGGLARATADAAHVLDAAGYPVILVETVGAGQSEVDIARMAHTTLVIQMPATGDEIQAIKAGILEIADIIVVNKADLPGADQAVAALEAMLDLNSGHTEWHHGQLFHVEEALGKDQVQPAWRPPVLKTCALRGEGIEELMQAIIAHLQYQRDSGLQRQRDHERAMEQLQRILRYTLLEQLLARIPKDALQETVERIVAREQDPYSAAEMLIAQAKLLS